MSRRKNQNNGGGEGTWLSTYSDMVTLLLSFFVLLYAISSVDEQKYEKIVKSFNPSIIEDDTESETAPGTTGGADLSVEDQFKETYERLKQYIENNNLQNSIELGRGDDFAFISFKNHLFFDGDSSQIKEEGKQLLDGISGALGEIDRQVQEIRILGHTSQGSPNFPNPVEEDRKLSSDRATNVLIYLQNKNMVKPYKLVSIGYGQYRPISAVDTKEGRAKNRRVEIIIARKREGDSRDTLEQYYQQMYKDNPEVKKLIKYMEGQ